MLGTGRVAKESESSNEYFRLSLTNSWLFIPLARRKFVGGYVSALGVGAGCLYYDIILKTAKRHRAARWHRLDFPICPGSFLAFAAVDSLLSLLKRFIKSIKMAQLQERLLP